MKHPVWFLACRLLAATALFPILGYGQSGFTWTRTTPASENIDSVFLDQMVNQISMDQLPITSFLLVRHGKIVYEGYYNGSSATALHELNSATKSFVSLSLSLLMDKGLLTGGLDQKATGVFPALTPANPSALKSAMTLRNVLSMSSGHASDTWETVEPSANWAQSFLDVPVVNQPGQIFLYDNGNPDFISALIHDRSGQTFADFAVANLFNPLGIAQYTWESGSNGETTGSRGLSLTTRDLAKFGLLCVQQGQWQGQSLVSSSYLSEAGKPQVYQNPGQSGFNNSGYGFFFWMNDFGGYRADGGLGQYVVILPDLDAVAVFTADNSETATPPDVYSIQNYVVPAIRPDTGETRAPSVTSGPLALTVNEGNSATLAVAASGQNLHYTWYHNNVALRDEHASTLTLSSVTPNQAGIYTAAVGNTFGTVLSAPAAVVVATPTANRISSMPPALSSVALGQDLTFTLSLTDSAAVSIQWRHNLQPITGATATRYTIASASLYDHGEYDAIVSDANGRTITPPSFVNVYVKNSQIVSWGPSLSQPTTYAPAGLNTIAGVYESNDDSMGLAWDRDGTLSFWGTANDGKGNFPTNANQIVSVTGTFDNLVALRADGTVVSWGSSGTQSHEQDVPAGLKNVVAVASGDYRNFALEQDGTVVSWGYGDPAVSPWWGTGDSDSSAYIYDLPTLPKLVAISGTGLNVNGISETGDIANISVNVVTTSGAPPQSNVAAVSSGVNYGLGLKSDGTVFSWGDDSGRGSIVPSGLNQVTALAAGGSSSIAVKSDGSVATWGVVGQTTPAGTDHVVAVAAGSVNVLVLRDASGVPWIVSSPANASVAAGGATTFSAATNAASGQTDQWETSADGGSTWTLIHDGVDYSGTATGTLSVLQASASINGELYRDRVSNAAGSAPSKPAQLTVQPGAGSKLINISTRSAVASGENVLIAGFIISGPSPKKVLIRAAGPALAAQGVSGVLPDPVLELHDQQNNGALIASNDDWDPSLLSDFAHVGVSTWPTGSKDAALVATLAPGGYTAITRDKNGASGIALIEVFEYDFTDPNRMINISSRSRVGTGASVQIAGFIINGSAPKRVLIRANGPALQNFGVADVLLDPVLELHDQANGGALIATNDDWDPSLLADFNKCGVTSWPSGSKDAAIAITLNPGGYTAIVSGKNGTSGVALVEVFDEP